MFLGILNWSCLLMVALRGCPCLTGGSLWEIGMVYVRWIKTREESFERLVYFSRGNLMYKRKKLRAWRFVLSYPFCRSCIIIRASLFGSTIPFSRRASL